MSCCVQMKWNWPRWFQSHKTVVLILNFSAQSESETVSVTRVNIWDRDALCGSFAPVICSRPARVFAAIINELSWISITRRDLFAQSSQPDWFHLLWSIFPVNCSRLTQSMSLLTPPRPGCSLVTTASPGLWLAESYHVTWILASDWAAITINLKYCSQTSFSCSGTFKTQDWFSDQNCEFDDLNQPSVTQDKKLWNKLRATNYLFALSTSCDMPEIC